MALSEFQSSTLKLLAKNRRVSEGSYVAGGLALNYSLKTPRLSRDIDIFNDSIEAMHTSWRLDRETLINEGYSVKVLREIRTFIEAEVSKGSEHTEIQWGTDSSFRFFPLCEDETTGFTLHPIDLAANKLSALVGRTEPRDWIDVIESVKNLQGLVDLLLKAGADPNAVNRNGETPLHIAAKLEWHDNVRSLLKGGASPDIKTCHGDTPLDIANEGENPECVTILSEWLASR